MAVKAKDAMGKIASKTENAPITTSTRVPPEKFESDNEPDNESDDEDDYPPTLTATRVS